MAKDVILSLIHWADRSGDDAYYPVDIVFVHGLGGDPYRTWAATDSSTLWPQSILPKDIPGIRVLTVGYQPQVAYLESDLVAQHAKNLLEKLAEQRGVNQKSGRKIVFCAHSLGGIIVKQALVIASNGSESDYRNILDSTLGVVFFGTPHSAQAEDLTRVLQYAIHAGRLRAELHDSSLLHEVLVSLQRIQQNFEDFCLLDWLNIKIISFYEELKVPGFGLVVDDRTVLAKQFVHLPLHANHETICKFATSTEANYRRFLGELKKILRLSIEKSRALSREEQECLQWLRIGNGREKIASPLEGTCNWVLHHREFRSWLTQDLPPFLWISGTPGSGKSVLTSYIVQEFVNHSFGTSPVAAVVYYFCGYGDNSHKPLRKSLFQSLLFQLLSQIPGAMSDCVPRIQQKREQYKNLGANEGKHEQQLAHALEDLFETCVTKVSNTHPVYIIIDGLDECEDEEGPRVLSLLSILHSKPMRNSVRFCVSARPYAFLKPFFPSRYRKICLEKENGEDIKRFTQLKLERQLQYSIEASRLVESIVHRASGVFLWVKLVVDSLVHSNDPDDNLERKLGTIPNDLGSLYRNILDRMTANEGGSGSLARKFLTWVSFSRRPLSVEEWQVVLSLDTPSDLTSGGVLSSLVTNELLSGPKLDKAWITTKLCWGFVETRPDRELKPVTESNQDCPTSYLVYIVHQSAREFLQNVDWTGDGSKCRSKSDLLGSVHNYLAITCLQYLSVHAKANSQSVSTLEKYPKYPLLQYATRHWVEHAKLADGAGSHHSGQVQILRLLSSELINHWIKLYQSGPKDNASPFQPGWTAIHAVAAFGLYSLALSMDQVEESAFVTWDIGDATGRTPLSWAAQNGHSSLTRVLIQKGASVRTRDALYGFSPLHWAALRGHEAVIKLLLEAGAEVNDQVGGSTPLTMAAARDHQDVVKMLLEKGADPNIIDKHYGQAPLHFSAARGNIIAASHLLHHGADLNLVDRYSKRTALFYAIAKGHRETARALIDRGACITFPASGTSDEGLTTWADRVLFGLLRTHEDWQTSCPQGPSTTSEAAKSVPNRGAQTTNGEAKGSQKTSSKRRCDDRASSGESGDGGSGEDPNKYPALDTAPSSPAGEPRLRLACPYFKHSPERYAVQKLCRGPDGWPSVHRLKQHLYQKHYVRACLRCGQTFQTDQDLKTHAKAEPACPAQFDRNYADGFDDEQKAQLKPRTRKRVFPDELEYWRDVYQILFPKTTAAMMPSPFYTKEGIDYASYDESSAHMRRHDPHLRAQLLEIVPNPVALDSVLNLINQHQASVIRPALVQNDGSLSTRTDPDSATQCQSALANSARTYRPFSLGDDLLSSDGGLLSQMMQDPGTSQPYLPDLDSGFFSASSAATQFDMQSLSFYSADDGEYASGHHASSVGNHARDASQMAEMHDTIDPQVLYADDVAVAEKKDNTE